jgi:hypothetical protein
VPAPKEVAAARPALHLIQQVVVLVGLGLLERELRLAVANPFG